MFVFPRYGVSILVIKVDSDPSHGMMSFPRLDLP